MTNLTQSLQEKFEKKFGTRSDWLKLPADTPFAKRSQIDFYDELTNFIEQSLEETEKRVREEMTEKVNRVEVIDHNGRAWGIWQDGIKVKVDLQDEGRTLKLFVTQPKEEK